MIMAGQTNHNSSTWSFPVRLLSSVAVVGRDNEPIYLRGSLSDSSILLPSSSSSTPSSPAIDNNKSNAASKDEERAADWSGSDEDDGGDNRNNNKGGESATEDNNSSSKPGLFGRIKGAIRKNDNEGDDDE